VPGPVPDHAPPSWLPAERTRGYVDYLQTFCHNVNVLRFILETGDRARVKYADLNADGFTGVVLLDVDGTRAVMETGWLRHHRWDEHVQIYFERGWVKVTAAPNMQPHAPPSDVESTGSTSAATPDTSALRCSRSPSRTGPGTSAARRCTSSSASRPAHRSGRRARMR
jgi:predicted dehydrogenase